MTAAALPSPYLDSSQSLEKYLSTIRTYPMLSEEDELEVAKKLRDEDDIEAAKKLVVSHLRFVVHIARSYAGYGLSLLDLIQEGNIGLMKAVRRYDPNAGVRLISFAVYWIKSEIHEFIIRNWRIVKIATTKAQRKLFYNLRSAQKRLGWMTVKEVEKVAEDLNVPTDSVYEMEQRLAAQDASFEGAQESGDKHGENNMLIPTQYLEAEGSNPEIIVEKEDTKKHQTMQLQGALGKLDNRSQDIVQQRWLQEKPSTLQQLADKYSISTERIRQIEQSALTKIRQGVSL